MGHQLVERQLSTCDGHLVGKAEFGSGPVDVKNMSKLLIYPMRDPHPFSKLRGTQMRSLMPLFEVVNGVIDGTWKLSYPPTPDNPLIAFEKGHKLAWLDRRYGYLPVRVTYFDTTLRRTVSDQTTEFQNVNGTFWFPLRGRHEYPDWEAEVYYPWEIRRVQLNAEFPDSDFETPTPDAGTRVDDRYRTPREARIKSELIPPAANSWSDLLSQWFTVLTRDSNILYVLLGGLCLLLGALITRSSFRDEQKSKSDKD